MSLQFVYPEITLCLMALAALVAGLTPTLRKYVHFIALVAFIKAVWILPAVGHAPTNIFFGLLEGDRISFAFRFLVLLGGAFVVMLSVGQKDIQEEDRGEFYFFLLALAASMMLAVSSNNLLMIYIALEATSILSYILAGFFKDDVFSSEAGLKYFLFGALATGTMLYGVSMMYGLTGSLDLSHIMLALQSGTVNPAAFTLAFILILGGFAFKCSLVPFHMAAPDAYQGAPTSVSLLLSIGPKAMGFALLVRFLMGFSHFSFLHWPQLMQALAILTMTIGNFIALKQTNVKRMLAFSSIAHAGFMLMALAVANLAGIHALIFYLFIYIFMNAGAFGCVILTNRQNVDDYAGLARQNPWVALIMTVALLSLAGLPPLAGFMAKFVVLAAVVQAKMYVLAIIAVVNSVVALFYYLRIVKAMYLEKGDRLLFQDQKVACPLFLVLFALMLTLLANLLLGLFPYASIVNLAL